MLQDVERSDKKEKAINLLPDDQCARGACVDGRNPEKVTLKSHNTGLEMDLGSPF